MIYFLTILGFVFIYMTCWFVVSLFLKRNDIADIAWGLGFIITAFFAFFLSEEFAIRQVVVLSLVALWGLRLSLHIYFRNRGKKEDYRYALWRKAWGKWFYIRSYFQVYIFQGVMLFLIISPVLAIAKFGGPELGLLDALGVLVWWVGFLFESVGDMQLTRFLKDKKNKGKLMQSGLWKYTRHPNYFGEVLGWWGIFIIALSVPYGVFSVVGPLTITILILKLSGIPLLEKKMQEHPDFEDYSKRVSVFFPLPPKRI